MKIQLPDYIKTILNRLNENGFEAYVVGGAVRDSVFGIEPPDYDIATSAAPYEIINVFSDLKTLEVGIRFGTVTVIIDNYSVEITTYRSDGEYKDNRHPESISFVKSLREDLLRRDLTINAMAYSEKDGLIDFFGGLEDIRKKIIRAVGDPKQRFSEDYLRIMRAVRFATVLDFLIDPETSSACSKYAEKLNIADSNSNETCVSAERIQVEFSKIILANKPSNGLDIMRNLGLLKPIIPELVPTVGFNQRTPYHNNNVFRHTLDVLDKTPKALVTRLAALLHDVGKPKTFSLDEDGVGHFYGHEKVSADLSLIVLERLKYSNQIIQDVKELIYEHMRLTDLTSDKGLKKQLRRLGEIQMHRLIDLQIGDRLSKANNTDISDLIEKRIRVERIINRKEPFNRKDLAIDGNDLMAIGINEGKDIGLVLEELLNEVIEKPSINTREQLIDRAKAIINKVGGKYGETIWN